MRSFRIDIQGEVLSGVPLAEEFQQLLGSATEELAIASYVLTDFYLPSHDQKLLDVFFHKLTKDVKIYILLGRMPQKYMRDRLKKLHMQPNATVRICPRVHMKAILADRQSGIISTGNVSSRGTAVAKEKKRNFEIGVSVNESTTVQILRWIVDIAHGDYCLPDTCLKFSGGDCPGVRSVNETEGKKKDK